jgi:hypothetical protein
MASVEITWAVSAAITGWAATALGLIWQLARKSKEWDHAEKHHKLLLGDPDTYDLGLVHRVHSLETGQVGDGRIKTVESDLKAATAQVLALSKALNAYGADEAAIVDAVRAKIQEICDSNDGVDPFPNAANTNKAARRR